MKSWMGPIAWMAGIAGAAFIAATVDPHTYAGGRARDDQERLRRNSSALAAMLGEFRTSMSDIMFIKTERYLHGGVAYLPHHDESVLSAGDLADEVDEHQSELSIALHDAAHHDHDHSDHDHAGTPTHIPVPERDFRGFIGRLHRQVKPWRDPDKPHIHTDGRELLPWFRIMTLTDPHYVPGYVAGVFWVQAESATAALSFINQGIRDNPDAFQLYVSRGVLQVRLARMQGDISPSGLTPDRRVLLEQARADFRHGAELAIRQRPAAVLETGEVWQPGWGAYLEDDAARACQMAVQLTRDLGDPDEALALATRYLRYFPDYAPLRDAIHPVPETE